MRRRLRRLLRVVLLAAGLMFAGSALLGSAGCEVPEDEFYKKETRWDVGRKKNPYRKYAFSYIALTFLGTFMMWTVCKSSKRSVVKAGQEH